MASYAVADLHGQLDLYNQICAFINPEDRVFCLGDSGDRGPHPWETLKTSIANPQFTYIKGNHDDMLVKAWDQYKEQGICDFGAQYLLTANGGMPTLEQVINDPDSEYIIEKIRNAPASMIRINERGRTQILCHAGFTPRVLDHIPATNHYYTTSNGIVILPEEEDLLWSRTHFRTKWPDNAKDIEIIHGHTNRWSLEKKWNVWDNEPIHTDSGAFWYADKHKCCLDNCSFITGDAVLLNLDTYEEHIFHTEDKPKNYYLYGNPKGE